MVTCTIFLFFYRLLPAYMGTRVMRFTFLAIPTHVVSDTRERPTCKYADVLLYVLRAFGKTAFSFTVRARVDFSWLLPCFADDAIPTIHDENTEGTVAVGIPHPMVPGNAVEKKIVSIIFYFDFSLRPMRRLSVVFKSIAFKWIVR